MTLGRFWDHDLNPDLAMQPFTWQHYLLILLGIMSVYFTLKYAQIIFNSKHEQKIKKGFAIWLIFLEIIYHLHYWSYGMFSVPLHVCSFGVMFSVYVLLTDSEKVFQYLFFTGIFGGLMALFVPNSLGYTYYNMRYYHFILLHMSIAIVPIYYYKAYNYRVSLKSVYKTLGFFFLLMPFVSIINMKFDRNYMFIGEKPQIIASILPEYPYYLFVFVITATVACHSLFFLSNMKKFQPKEV